MKFIGIILAASLLAACGLIHPFGDATVYEPYSVSARPGVVWRYECIREALEARGYDVESIFPEQDSPNFFDISRDGQRIARVDMSGRKGDRTMAITLIAGSKAVNEALGRIIAPCVQR